MSAKQEWQHFLWKIRLGEREWFCGEGQIIIKAAASIGIDAPNYRAYLEKKDGTFDPISRGSFPKAGDTIRLFPKEEEPPSASPGE